MRRTFSDCCATAASGQVAVEPAITFMKSRRLIASPEAQDKASCGINVAHWKVRRRGQPMSALGQKRTCAVQNGMSALPPKATSNATDGMPAKGQKRTLPKRATSCFPKIPSDGSPLSQKRDRLQARL